MIVLATIAPAGAARGDPRDDKKRIDAEVARASSILEGATERAQQAARQLVKVSGKLPAAQQLVIESKGQVVAAQVQAETAQRKAEVAQAEVASAQKRFAEADRERRAGQEQIGELAAAAYKGGASGQPQRPDAGGKRDRHALPAHLRRPGGQRAAEDHPRLPRRAAVARRQENDATLARASADEAMLSADSALDDASVAEDQAQDAVREVAELVRQKEEALTAAQEERAASLQKYKEAKAEEAKIAAALRAWEAKQRAAAEARLSAGRLLIPVHGEKSSDFGSRFDPYYHVWQLHAGMDLAADGGTPIHAAAAGRVIMAGWNGGYGNYTCISHGKYRGKNDVDLLRTPVRDPRPRGTGGTARPDHRPGRHDRRVDRRPPALRGPDDGDPVQPLTFLPPCLC